jgi:hypothetical protein
MSATADKIRHASCWPESQDGSDLNAHGQSRDQSRTWCGRRMSGNWIFADTDERPVDCPRCLVALENSARNAQGQPDCPSDADLDSLKSAMKPASSRMLYALRYYSDHLGDVSARERYDAAVAAYETASAAFYGAVLTAAAVMTGGDLREVAA